MALPVENFYAVTSGCVTASLPGDPTVTRMEEFHRSWDLRHPDEGQCPPNLAGHGHDRIGTAEVRTIGRKESQFSQSFFR